MHGATLPAPAGDPSRGRAQSLLEAPLRSLTRRAAVTVSPATTLAECLAAIRQEGTGDSVMVCSGSGRLVGVLTERDIFAHLAGTAADLTGPVEALMNREPHTFGLDDPIREALRLMATGRYRNIPLVDPDGDLVGVVRPQDILAYLAEAYPETILNLPPRPHQQMEVPEGA